MSDETHVYEAWAGPRDGSELRLRDDASAYVILGEGSYERCIERPGKLVWRSTVQPRKRP